MCLHGSARSVVPLCAQALSVCVQAEQLFHTQRESEVGDSARIASLGFVDDLQFKYAYELSDRGWTRAAARAMLEQSRTLFPPPLTLE